MISLKIAPVDFERKALSDWLPGMTPYEHQEEVFRLARAALDEKRFLCIFNQAATGGGKTLASYAYPLLHEKSVIGIYPTNELIEDQLRSLKPLSERFHCPVHKVDSVSLDVWEKELETSGHARTLEDILAYRNIILTNPDIVYLTFFGVYSKSKHSPGLNQRLFNRLCDYDIYIFDEFHLYDIKQVGNIITMVGVLNALQKGKRGKVFIFSSATPNQTFLEVLNRLGIEWKIVVGKEASNGSENIRRVSHEVQVQLIPAPVNQWKALKSIRENWSLIENFIQIHEGARIVAIMDAVADAVQLTKVFRERFGTQHVGEIHGLSSRANRENALQKTHTIGTSTIEVGIDLNDVNGTGKDLLIFEAKTAAQFTQRLGRIARHEKESDVPNCAICLVPGYVYHFVRENLTSAEIRKNELTDIISEAYRSRNQFLPYFKLYSPVEAFDVRNFVRYQMQPDTFERVTKVLDDTIEVMSERQIDAIARSYTWLKGHNMLSALQNFRGQSFSAALIDHHEDAGNPIKTYDLFFILRRARFKSIPEKYFFKKCYEYQEKFPELVKGKRRFSLITPDVDDHLGVYGYFEIEDILDDARRVWFEIYQDKLDMNQEHSLTILKGLKIGSEPELHLKELNRLIKKKIFVCWFSRYDTWSLTAMKSLPPLFQLYELRVKKMNGFKKYSVAFGLNAYFIHSILRPDKEEKKV